MDCGHFLTISLDVFDSTQKVGYLYARTDSHKYRECMRVPEFCSLFLLIHMRTGKSSQSADTDMNLDLASDYGDDDMDTMCLVYPDGRTKTVSTPQSQSKD